MSLFDMSDRSRAYQAKLQSFMDEHIYPAEAVYDEQMRKSGNPHFQPPIMEGLKTEARKQDLWNLFHPHPSSGVGLTNLEYAPLAEILGHSHIASEACNCSAPDTGNMEALELFGTPEHKEKYLKGGRRGSEDHGSARHRHRCPCHRRCRGAALRRTGHGALRASGYSRQQRRHVP